MKTKNLIITSIFLLGLFLLPQISMAAPSAEENQFKEAISSSVKYPAFASENKLEGIIWIDMTISEEGIMTVKASNHSCCKEFAEHVSQQIDGKKIKKFKPEMVGQHHVKFSFSIE
ncbi:MAG: hypothetical protein KAH25_08900 [Bacteroidales bacterium]|nr:hypothetical protein [Bacteroidales bacterium]